MNRNLSLSGVLQGRPALKFILPVAIIIGWELLAIVLDNPFILPRLESVLSVLLNPTVDILGNGNLIDNAIISLERVVAGFIVATALAIPLGIGMGRSDTVHEIFDSVMQLLRPIPPLAWVPLALAWFKIGLVSMVFIIGMGAFFPILLNTLDGVKGVKKDLDRSSSDPGSTRAPDPLLRYSPGRCTHHLDRDAGWLWYRMDVRGRRRDDARNKFRDWVPDHVLLQLGTGTGDHRRYHRDRPDRYRC